MTKELYEVMMGQDWAKAPLDYLTTTHHAIVSRFEESFRYVSLRPENAETFSYEFASILRDACSAFGSFSDAVIRASSSNVGKKKKLEIDDFFDFYSQYAPDLPKGYIDVAGVPEAYRLQPFWGWSKGQPPRWWTAHNKIKHSEYDNIKQGNLQNATNAVAAVETTLRRATKNQRGTRLFSDYGGPWARPWEPGQPGTQHIKRLFEP